MSETQRMKNNYEVGDIVYLTSGHGPLRVESSRLRSAILLTWFDAEGKERLGLEDERHLTTERPTGKIWSGPAEYPAMSGDHPAALPSYGPPDEADIAAGRYLSNAERATLGKGVRSQDNVSDGRPVIHTT